MTGKSWISLFCCMEGKLDEVLKLIRQSIELALKQAGYFNNLATVLGRMNKAMEASSLRV